MSAIKALLLTDVVDSTQLAQKIGDSAMAEIWAAHDRIARALLEPWHGREIDKTDGMLLLFDNCADAVGYAMAYHAALATMPSPIAARAGLHVGPVILRENAPDDIARGAKPLEVEGLAKPIAARVMALAHGGQTLLSAAAREALGTCEHKLVSHGHWRIKGVSDPIELFEVAGADAQFVVPADGDKAHRVVWMGDWWLPVNEIPNNLPFQATSFIGRERELEEVKSLLKTSRLLSLVGMGGLGKTRLSLQIAAQQIHDFPDGVWFLDLAPISDPTLIVSAAAQVLGVREEPDRPLLQTVCAHLRNRRALLILDNCEQVVAAAAQMASALIKMAPHVRILASSREPLRAPGEHCYLLLPLPVPARGDGMEAMSRSTAVRLFIDRAQQHKPAFRLTEREAPAVAELVARLEGIPLAIELAAARIRALSVADINTRLQDRYKLLTGGSRVLQERQQTLRALVDWSYELLTAEEQIMLDRLGVFVGGFDLAAAEAVCGLEPIAGGDVLDLLQSLIEKSLVMLEERDDGARYLMLETIREYAREKLAQRDDAAAVAARHCEHYFAMAKAAKRRAEGTRASRLAVAARGRARQHPQRHRAVARRARRPVHRRQVRGRDAGLLDPARLLDRRPQARAGGAGAAGDPGVAGRPGPGRCTSARRWPKARATMPRRARCSRPASSCAERWATRSTSPPRSRRSRWRVSRPAMPSRPPRARARRWRFSGASTTAVGEAIGLLHLGQIWLHRGDDAMARSYLEQCLAVAHEIRHQEVEGECELVLGEVALETGDAAQACLAVQALADGVSRSRRQARRGERAALARAGRTAVWRPRVGAGAALRCLARLPRLRDARGAARLPRRPRRACGGGGQAGGRRRLGSRGGPITRSARPAPVAARRAALAGARRPAAARDDRRAVQHRVETMRSELQIDEAISQALSAPRERATA